MNKKKKTIIAILSAIAVLAVAIAGFFYVKQQRYEQSINEKITAISNTSSGFQNAERSSKLTLLQELQKELKEYKESENPDEKVITKYESEIASMKAYFVEEYNKAVADNTVAAEAEKKAKLHYENEYFTIDIPESWLQQGRTWQINPYPDKYKGVIRYSLSQSNGSPYGTGGGGIYVFTEGVIPRGMTLPETTEIGKTSSGALVVREKYEVSSGFFDSGKDKPVLKLK